MKSSELAQKAIDKVRQGKNERRAEKQNGRAVEFAKTILAGIAISLCILIGMIFLYASHEKNKNYVKTKGAIKSSAEKSIKNNFEEENLFTKKEEREKVTYRKKEIMMYVIHLKNGKMINYKKTPEIRNGMVILIENHIKTEIPASELTKIEGIWQ
ncbi:MAG: hypothetical protein ACTFAK_11155 [Candidatus Electronema sp. VV]